MKIRIVIIALSVLAVVLSNCKPDERNPENGHSHSNSSETNDSDKKEKSPFSIAVSEPEDVEYKLGESIDFTINAPDSIKLDSAKVFFKNKLIHAAGGDKKSFKWTADNARTGFNTLEIEYYCNGKSYQSRKQLEFFPAEKPKQFGYELVKVYKHDVNAYTQGLFYHKGFLYEATGLRGESTIRKVKLETGEVVQSFAIPTEIFGEGIVLYDNKIIQLSWDAGRGFVYDLDSFKLLDEFSYSGEGWGLCSDGEKLYMTDGTPYIRVLDPVTYAQIDRLHVYDHKGPVKFLNESEFINGEIYANIYQYEKIARIDPLSGKVIAYIDLSGILPMNDWTSQTDVLNGIAYDEAGERLFVTGKKWPKLFEIKIKPK